MDKSTVDALIAEEKILLNYKPFKMNCKESFKLKGTKNDFVLDYQIGETGTLITFSKPIQEMKQKYQTRYKGPYLIRLEINARPHLCVDSGKLCKNHIHIYCGDDVCGNPIYNTYELDGFSKTEFKNLSGLNVLLDFFKICHIRLEDGVTIQEII